ncbi:MAG TPA: SAM-dependent methyltransferase [Candidatus Sulfomarinibacteraceae bacterium]|nr:SAM-dependent methyltransferase [Candidatus Sulfomarinibacteraceae bacterium]
MSNTAKPAAIISADPWSLEQARTELLAAAPGARVLAQLGEGELLAALPGSFWELAERWQQRGPIFIRHVNPVQETTPLPAGEGAEHTTDALRDLALERFAPLMEPDLPFSVQTRIFANVSYGPYDVNTALAEALQDESGAPLDVRDPEQILSVVIAHYEGQLTAFLGLSPVAYNLSDWAGGKRRYRRGKEQISRSEFKLLEALEVFGIELPPRGVALDLGAAPGGWTRILRQQEQYVTAVDPGELDRSLQADPDIRHKQTTAEEYLEVGPDQFDLIVNDMRLDARDSARLMVEYAPFLYRDGQAIMTLKLPEENQEPIIDHAFNILRQAYTIAGARQLFHNRSEVTVWLRRAGTG